MAKRAPPVLPPIERLLAGVGEQLRTARLRRRLQAKQVAERAGISVMTLRAVERGTPGASIGSYAAVLQVLGLEDGLALLARDDPLGRRLQDAGISSPMTAARPRASRSPKAR